MRNQSISILQTPSSVPRFSASFRSCLQLYAPSCSSDVPERNQTTRDLPGVCLNRVRFAPQSSPRSKAVSHRNAEKIPSIRQSLDTQTVPIQHRIFQRNPGHVTSQSKHLIAALQNILSKLELTELPGRDEKSFAELKRILRQRIQDLQNRAAIPALIAKPAKTTNNAD